MHRWHCVADVEKYTGTMMSDEIMLPSPPPPPTFLLYTKSHSSSAVSVDEIMRGYLTHHCLPIVLLYIVDYVKHYALEILASIVHCFKVERN